jgi:hypothetical protein
MAIKKITPVLLVDEVEPCVRFWKERLSFEVVIEVPEGEKIGFVSLQKAGVELMYQSYASLEKDSSFSARGYAKGTYVPVHRGRQPGCCDLCHDGCRGSDAGAKNFLRCTGDRSKRSGRARSDFCAVRGLKSLLRKEPLVALKRCKQIDEARMRKKNEKEQSEPCLARS